MAESSSSSLPPADAELVDLALAGSRDAFNQLVIRHEQRLFRFLSRNAPCLADAEDAMQQALVKAYLNLSKYQPRWKFTTWLFTIALRELRSHGRKNVIKTQSLDAAADHPAAPPAPTGDESGLWDAAKRVLSDSQYTALWLRYGEDLAVREIATVTRRPRIWVSVNLHRACAALRRHIKLDQGVPIRISTVEQAAEV